jgi:hypothetical protein
VKVESIAAGYIIGPAGGRSPIQGKRKEGEVHWHGTQRGSVYLSQRKLPVEKPRLRTKGKGGKKVAVPAYAAMQDR